jgi:hypothetical protein
MRFSSRVDDSDHAKDRGETKWKKAQREFFNESAEVKEGQAVGGSLLDFISKHYYPIHLDLLRLAPGKNLILDVGSGDGSTLFQLGMANPKCYAVGVDMSIGQLNVAKNRTKTCKSDVDFVCADVAALPFRASVFNVLTAINVLHHLSSFVCLRDFHRVLKRTGTLYTYDHAYLDSPLHLFFFGLSPLIPRRFLEPRSDVGPNCKIPPVLKYSFRDLKKLLVSCGFQNLKVQRNCLLFEPIIVASYFTLRALNMKLNNVSDFAFKALESLYRLDVMLIKAGFADFCYVFRVWCYKS